MAGPHPALQVGTGIAQAFQPLPDVFGGVALGADAQNRQIPGKLAGQVLLNAGDDRIHHLVFAPQLQHLEVRNIDGGPGLPPFEAEPFELVAVAHVEHKELLAALQGRKKIIGRPY